MADIRNEPSSLKMTYTTEHYVALLNNLSSEKKRLADATSQAEIELRSVWVKQLEKEIAHEVEFLASKGIGVYAATNEVDDMSDDDLLNELMS